MSSATATHGGTAAHATRGRGERGAGRRGRAIGELKRKLPGDQRQMAVGELLQAAGEDHDVVDAFLEEDVGDVEPRDDLLLQVVEADDPVVLVDDLDDLGGPNVLRAVDSRVVEAGGELQMALDVVLGVAHVKQQNFPWWRVGDRDDSGPDVAGVHVAVSLAVVLAQLLLPHEVDVAGERRRVQTLEVLTGVLLGADVVVVEAPDDRGAAARVQSCLDLGELGVGRDLLLKFFGITHRLVIGHWDPSDEIFFFFFLLMFNLLIVAVGQMEGKKKNRNNNI